MSTNPPSKSQIAVLFVCMGNICRSPAAEGIFQAKIDDAGLSDCIKCDSAGTIGFHSSQRADRRMRAAAQKRGYELHSYSRKIKPDDYSRFDHIIAMDDENYASIIHHASDSDRARISMMCSYSKKFNDTEVPDPYYGGDQGFEHVLDLLEDSCAGLLEEIRKELD